MHGGFMEWNHINGNVNMPDEFRIVILRGIHDGCDGCLIAATLIMGKWVTDATTSDVYGAEGHCDLIDFEPKEWSYVD